LRPVLTVYYNGGCSICGPEVALYQRMAEAAGAGDLIFQNIATGTLPDGYSRETLLKRIHAREGDTMLVGVEAFIAMWLRLPRFKYLARAIDWPLMRGTTGLIYNLIIAPYLYRRYRRETCAIG
jgi:predicted DCC family thiol-disulfide oxidoreductase YuxK